MAKKKTEKLCAICLQIKPVSEFGIRKSGAETWCKPFCEACGRERRKKIIEAMRARALNRPRKTEKPCTFCRQIKPISEFGIKDQSKNYYHPFCKACALLVGRENYKRRPTENLECHKKWVRQNLEKVRSYYRRHSYKKRGIPPDLGECIHLLRLLKREIRNYVEQQSD